MRLGEDAGCASPFARLEDSRSYRPMPSSLTSSFCEFFGIVITVTDDVAERFFGTSDFTSAKRSCVLPSSEGRVLLMCSEWGTMSSMEMILRDMRNPRPGVED